MTVATDGAAMYETERRSYEQRRYPDGFDEVNAGETVGRHLDAIADDHVLELSHVERTRIFNLGYYTWVEQQGVSLKDFDGRKHQPFWQGLVDTIPEWDRLIDEFNEEVGHAPKPRAS
jgi:cysteine synthase